MRCPNCNEEIVLAKVCPYCGQKVSQTTKTAQKSGRVRGKFRGPMRNTHSHDSTVQGMGPLKLLRAVLNMMRDPQASLLSKAIVVIAALYVLHPMDIVPDIFIGMGWLDDIAVLALAWRYLSDKLQKYLT